MVPEHGRASQNGRSFRPSLYPRPGVEPRHKLRTEINVVDGSAKLVYLSDLGSPWHRQYLKVLGTKGVFGVSSDEGHYTQNILFCVRWGTRSWPIRRHGGHFVRHLHMLRQFRTNVIWIVTFWFQGHISIFIAIIKLKNILPLVQGPVRRFRIAPVSKCASSPVA